ncbi:MAG: lysophospholipid acyltransferase family protein [Candidatus Parcubacteria bacterium]|nr:lysophospholipid acyltransferase family protein [Candidatus Parcubacteria bacterium]
METHNTNISQKPESESLDEHFEFPYWVTEFGQRLAWLILKPLFGFFMRFEVRGKENIKDVPTNVIFALNHISEIDALIPSCSFGIFSKHIPIYCVALKYKFYKEKKTFRSFFYRPWLFSFIGAYSVEKGLHDYERTLSRHIEFLKKGNDVEIFPEGKVKYSPEEIVEPRGGVVALSKVTGLPVVPVALYGHGNMSAFDFLLRRRKSVLIFGKPISAEEIFSGYENAVPEDYAKIAKERIMNKISALLEDYKKEITKI